MEQKTFYHHFQGRRPITVKIGDDGYISFHYKAEGGREFYVIPTREWISDKNETRQGQEDNWHFHMKEKIWFNTEIESFLNDNLLKKQKA